MNSSSAIASLPEAVLAANVKKMVYNALASILVIVKFNCYHKIILKLNTEKKKLKFEIFILFPPLLSFTNFYYTVILASNLPSVHLFSTTKLYSNYK